MKLKHSKLIHFQSNKLLEHFVGGASSRTVADLTKVILAQNAKANAGAARSIKLRFSAF